MPWQMNDIKDAYEHGKTMGATHMIVVYDSFDYTDYPIYVMPSQDPRSLIPTNGDRVVECYRFALGWERQAAETRAQHWEI